jgi:hypothetical protein
MAADQATGGKAASEVGKPQVFRSPTAFGVWVVWLLFAVANLIDLAVQGRDHVSLVAAGILVMVTGVAYVTAQRPRVIAEDRVLTIKNPLRDHRIPWTNIARVDISDLLRVHCRLPGPAESGDGKKGKVITAWAVHYSRRRQYSADVKARRDVMRSASRGGRRTGAMTAFGIPQAKPSQSASYGAAPSQEAEALKIVRLLNERITAAGIEQATERASDEGTILASRDGYDGYDGTGDAELLASTWSWRAVAALVVPALILLVVCLV